MLGEGAIKEDFLEKVDFELDLEGEMGCGHAEMGPSIPCTHAEAPRFPARLSKLP